mmetsp:Transcript_12594/g.16540  ORF Transcript_12594/g.16540 Transcript_12594/m.16540 type:complete len:1344 (-) Transcript_12594:168-4199(-)
MLSTHKMKRRQSQHSAIEVNYLQQQPTNEPDQQLCNLSKCTLRFDCKETESSFERTWNKEKKRTKMIIIMIPTFLAALWKCFVLKQGLSVPNTIVLVLWLTVLLVAFTNYFNKGRWVAVSTLNHIIYGMAMLAINTNMFFAAHDPNLGYSDLLMSLLTVTEIIILGPLTFGVFLDILFPALVCFEVLTVSTVYFIARSFIEQSCNGMISGGFSAVFIAIRGLFSSIVALAFSYIQIRRSRVSYVREQKLQAQERERVKEHFKYQHEIMEQKGKYIAQVAHDIGTPLATFSLAVELLRPLATTAEMRDIIETAQCAIDLMTVTRKEALDHAKHMEGLGLQPDYKEVFFIDILKRCSRLMQGTACQASACQNEFYFDPNLPEKIFTDYDWIWTMLVNFLSNAKKYSNGGKVITTVYDMGAMLRVEVADDGIGVPHDRRQHLFQPFGQLMKCAGGTGLGLHGVLLKANALEGDVGVRDNPASATGSTFWFQIPLKTVREVEEKAHAKVKAGSMLFLGEWPLRLKAEGFSYFISRFSTVDTIQNTEEFCSSPELVSRDYSVIFWLLDADTLSKPHEDLVHAINKMKILWAKQRSNGSYPFICISCTEFQFIVEHLRTPPQHPSSPVVQALRKLSGSRGHRTQSYSEGKSMSVLKEERIIMQTVSNQSFFPLNQPTPDQQSFMETSSRRLETMPSPPSPTAMSPTALSPTSKGYPNQANALTLPKLKHHPKGTKGGRSSRESTLDLSPSFRNPPSHSAFTNRNRRKVNPDSCPQKTSSPRAKIFAGAKRRQGRSTGGNRQFVDFVGRKSISHKSLSHSQSRSQSQSNSSFSVRSTPNGLFGKLHQKKKGSVMPSSSKSSKSRSQSKKNSSQQSISKKLQSVSQQSLTNSVISRPYLSGGSEEDEPSNLRHCSSPKLYSESPVGKAKGEKEVLLAVKLEKAIAEADCGVLIQHPLTLCDLKSLVLRIPDFQVVEERDITPETEVRPPPIEVDNNNALPSSDPCLTPTSSAIKSKSILLVDDDPSILKFTSRMLRNESYEVTTKVNGFEGLNSLKEQEYVVAIIDLNMPVMDGLECIRRFREWEKTQLITSLRGCRQPIIMLSANAHQSHREEAVNTGADRFVAKPVKMQELLTIINQVKQSQAVQRRRSKTVSRLLSTPLKKKLRDPKQRLVLESKESDSSGDGNNRRVILPAMPPQYAKKLPAVTSHDGKKKILLVDDETVMQKLAQKRLEQKGYLVATKSNGNEALALLIESAQNPFDAIIMDHQMPGMDGIECIRRYKDWESVSNKQSRKTNKGSACDLLQKQKIFFLTGDDIKCHPEWESVLSKIVNKVFVKPVDFDELIAAIEA